MQVWYFTRKINQTQTIKFTIIVVLKNNEMEIYLNKWTRKF